MDNIYNMDLHQVFRDAIQEANVIRVPGGWIYHFYDNDYITGESKAVSSVFVPFHEELGRLVMPKKKKSKRIALKDLTLSNVKKYCINSQETGGCDEGDICKFCRENFETTPIKWIFEKIKPKR